MNCTHRLTFVHLVAASLSLSVAATTLQPMSIAQLTDAAHAIVLARCKESESVLDRSGLWTISRFEVEETWKGNPSVEVQVRAPGGRAEHIIAVVSGIPRFRPGEEAVLFLQPVCNGDWGIVAWAEGTWRLRRRSDGTEIVIPDAFAGPPPIGASGSDILPASKPLSLAQLHGRVLSASASRPLPHQ